MTSAIRFPLSGAVNQTINPLEFWIRAASSQAGFINIYNSSSGDHQIEQRIVEDVASYGRQLGRINELLMTLLDKQELQDLNSSEQQTIDEFRQMHADIQAVKSRYQSPVRLLSGVDEMIGEIRKLKTEDPATYDKAVSRLKKELGL